MNQSYCRFRNTLDDLRDCQDHLAGELESPEEIKARERLIELCVEIACDMGDCERIEP